jgi:hypothetical protein
VDLYIAFAQKYLQQCQGDVPIATADNGSHDEQGRRKMGAPLLSALHSVSAKAWSRTENLLGPELLRHEISLDLIDPWQVSGAIHQVYKIAIAAYAQQIPPHKIVIQVSPILGQVRQQVTAIDPRVIGFVAMQYHYTGMQLIEMLPSSEHENFSSYVKVLDDHLYMPLHRAYKAAAQHPMDSMALQSVQLLMPMVSDIAERIVNRVSSLYPRYRCHSGPLNHPQIRVSSIRDVEMFQVFIWVCLLEGNLHAVETELFPLCVMIYPRLNVSWELISQMTHLLRNEVVSCLPAAQAEYCEPFYNVLRRLFSSEVFPNN